MVHARGGFASAEPIRLPTAQWPLSSRELRWCQPLEQELEHFHLFKHRRVGMVSFAGSHTFLQAAVTLYGVALAWCVISARRGKVGKCKEG